MALTVLDWEAGTNAANVATGATSGYSVITVGAGSTFTYSNAHAAHGTISQQIAPASGVATYGQVSGLNSDRMATTIYVWFDTLPTVQTFLTRAMTSAAVKIYDVVISATGKVQFLDSAATAVYTSTATVSTGQWVRIEAWGLIGASGSTGSSSCKFFLGDSTTPVETGYTNTGSSVLGTANFDLLRFGKTSASTFATTFWQDTAMYDNAASGLTGPYSVVTVNAGPDQTVDPGTTVTLTATHPSGTTVVWSQVSGSPTVTLV